MSPVSPDQIAVSIMKPVKGCQYHRRHPFPLFDHVAADVAAPRDQDAFLWVLLVDGLMR